jgi:hypothetical protein
MLGDNHPDILDTMNNLANTYSEQGKYAQAEVLYKQCLDTRRIVLGDNHPHTLSTIKADPLLFRPEFFGRFFLKFKW